jgi:hypothetical protein
MDTMMVVKLELVSIAYKAAGCRSWPVIDVIDRPYKGKRVFVGPVYDRPRSLGL